MRDGGRVSGLGLSSLAVMAIAMVATPAAAAQQTRSFDIADAELASALNTFARQADQQIIFSSQLVAGKRSRGVSGDMAPAKALDALLLGTGLRAEGDTIITLRAAAPEKATLRRIAYQPATQETAPAPARPAAQV